MELPGDDGVRAPPGASDDGVPWRGPSRASLARGFVVVHAGPPVTPLGFRDVHGFREAMIAAEDPRAPTPTRLDLAGPDEAAAAWLESWAEDVEQVRRRLTVRRFDAVEITLVATLASFGDGIATSLAVESIRSDAGGAILRSGVHPRAEVDAALAASGGRSAE